ncbi:uncharacterized protein LOC112351533 isoform X1 [Selaginella moellendorffii]|uniref:uncharacterized protein LOC112351533 isoform X1 n=1 Tax=Selaginella moellendorffii TaxID=88036 RepID=UPI000D1CBC60|nr:uncharacterized protein LOC112351533 isoform X1 [Selaginella moellendorffii]|eukprot:XP_024545358.1 uncharacterized protein LOC112351533 isoform X1 [Selaginella moellendorffii]
MANKQHVSRRPCSVDWRKALQVPQEISAILDKFRERELLLAKCVTKGSVGIPFFNQMPCMLFHRLTSFDYSNAQNLSLQVAKARDGGGRLVICAGSTGCGKTKSLYTFFSKQERGLLFTTSTVGSGGSSDLEFLMNEVLPKHLEQKNYYQNSVVVKFFTLLLLLVRMSILSLCRDFDLEKWLIFQGGCKGLYHPDANLADDTDVFRIFLAAVCRKADTLAPENFVKEIPALQKVLDDLCMPFEDRLPTIAIDEAHKLVSAFEDDFFVSRRPFYRDVVNFLLEPTLAQTKHVVVVSGTGYTLRYEGGNSTRVPVCGDFGCWKSGREMIEFTEQAVELTEEDRSVIEQEIYPRFKGRFGPFVQVVETALNRVWSIKEAAFFVERLLTTEGGAPQGYYRKLAELSQRTVLIGFMKRAVISYFCLGRGIKIHDTQSESHRVEEIADAGFGRLVASESGGHYVAVDEFLVLRAAANFFRDVTQGKTSLSLKDELLSRIGPDMEPCTSHQGFLYQNFGPFAFQRMWKQHGGVMQNMPLFSKILGADGCPEQLKAVAALKSEILEGQSAVCASCEGYSLREFLLERSKPAEERRCTTFVCPELLGPNAAFRIGFERGGGEAEAPSVQFDGFDQYSYWMHQLSQAELEEAISRSGIREEQREEFELCEKVQLCFLYLYPCSYSEHYVFKARGDAVQVVCFIHAENAHFIFNSAELELLDLIGRDDSVEEVDNNCGDTSSEEYPFF